MSLFTHNKLSSPKSNMHDLSFQNLLTTDFNRLVPCLVEECYPGDVIKLKTEIFTRFLPLASPILERCDLSIHAFYVPNRLVFEHFYSWLTEDSNNVRIPPYCNYSAIRSSQNIKTLGDYLNLPYDASTGTNNQAINLMPFLAYQLIYNEFYRDENLETDLFADASAFNLLVGTGGLVTNTTTIAALNQIRYRSFRKDYFTGSLPFAQKGSDVNVPIGDVKFTGHASTSGLKQVNLNSGTTNLNAIPLNDQYTYIEAEVAPTTINTLRRAFKVQEYLEKKARGGTRANEFIKSMWGVNTKDSRLNRPEFLGGCNTPIQISEVLSQSSDVNDASDFDTDLGRMGGHAKGSGYFQTKKYKATEHGYFMCLLSIVPRASYFQGLPRYLTRTDQFDYFTPVLANIGEQEVLNKEIYVNHTTPNGVFGYVPRYAECKVHQNEIHGDFRDTLSYWHLARIFGSSPGLNSTFLHDTGGLERIYTYTKQDYDHILVQLVHHNKMIRKMPYYGTPKL